MQKTWIVASAVLLGACPGKDGKGPAPGPGGDEVATAGFFDVLAVPGASWSLTDSMSQEEPRQQLVVSVADVQAVGDAKVVGMKVTVRYDPESEPEEQAGSRWAISPRGLWALDSEQDDAAVAAVLAGPPTWPSPPVEMDAETGPYLQVIELGGEHVACIGDIPDLEGEECPEVCGGGMCIAEKSGIVSIDGDWGPDPYAIYEQAGFERAAGVGE
jgi:hypothetical protein